MPQGCLGQSDGEAVVIPRDEGRVILAFEHPGGLVAMVVYIASGELTDEDVARIEDRIDAEARARQLGAAMDRLGGGERAVLELVVLDGLTVTDAAHALHIQPVTARVRLHRAKRALRDHLTPPAVPELTVVPEVAP